jgi:hypothetical protein
LVHNVHTGKPVLFHTRWALSYLAGPLTRDHVAQLMAPLKPPQQASEDAVAAAGAGGSPAERPPLPGSGKAQTCPGCTASLPEQAKFCPNCGTRLLARVDVAGEQRFKQAIIEHATQAKPAPVITSHVPPVLPAGVDPYFLPAIPLARRAEGDDLVQLVYEPRLLGFAEVAFRDSRKNVERSHAYHLLAPPPKAGQQVGWGSAEWIINQLTGTPEVLEAYWQDVPETMNDSRKLRALERAFVEFLYNNAKLRLYHNRPLRLTSEHQEDRETFRQRCREAARRAGDAQVRASKEQFRQKFESVAEKPAARVKVQTDWQAKLQKLNAQWELKGEDFQELDIRPRKSAIRVTHFGLAWTPLWQVRGADGPVQRIPAYMRQAAVRDGAPPTLPN